MDQNFNNGAQGNYNAPQGNYNSQGNYNAPQGNYNPQGSFDANTILKTEYLIGALAVLSALLFFTTTLRIRATGRGSELLSFVGADELVNIALSPLKLLTGLTVAGTHISGSFGAFFLLALPVMVAVVAFVKPIRVSMGDKPNAILMLALSAINAIIIFAYPLRAAGTAAASPYIKLERTFFYYISLFIPLIIIVLCVFVLTGMLQFGSLEFKKANSNPYASFGNVANNNFQPTVNNTTENTETKFCTNCGQKIEAGTSFCTNCGQKVQ